MIAKFVSAARTIGLGTLLMISHAQADGVDNGGISVESADGEFSAHLGGRIQVDFGFFDNDEFGLANGEAAQFRRARLAVEGSVYDWDYEIEIDYADDDPSARLLYVAHDLAGGQLRIGQILHYITLDARISSLHTTFTERSLLTTLLWPNYQIGAGYIRPLGESASYHVSGYLLDNNDEDTADGKGVIGRFAWAPLHDRGRVLHLGVGAAAEQYGDTNAVDSTGTSSQGVRLLLLPASRLASNTHPVLLSIDNGRDIDARKFAFEFAAVLGRVSVQAEYGRGDYDDSLEDGAVGGGYGYISYFLTNDVRPYDTKLGLFGRVEPRLPNGAWEIGLRYQHVYGEQNLVDGTNTRDIEVEAISAVLNWYYKPRVRLTLDITHASVQDHLAGAAEDRTTAATVRAQLDW